MSVYKTQRTESKAQFIVDAKNLRLETIRILKKFPKSYRWIITNNMLELSVDIFTNCIKGNSIFLTEKSSLEDYSLRHNYFMIALASVEAFLTELTFLYELVQEGNNFLGTSQQCEKIFYKWTKLAKDIRSKIQGVIKSDQNRYKSTDSFF